jgi:hypothetical protein
LLGVGAGYWFFGSMQACVLLASAGAGVILLVGLWKIDVELRTVARV